MATPRMRPVACIELGIIYPSATIAALDLKLDPVTIARCANDRLRQMHEQGRFTYRGAGKVNLPKTHGGYTFAQVEGAEPHTPGPFYGHTHTPETKLKMSIAKNAKKHAVYVGVNGVEQRFESVAAAVRETGVRRSAVSNILRGGQKSTLGMTVRSA